MMKRSLSEKISILNKQIKRMAKKEANLWTHDMMNLQTTSPSSFGLMRNKDGITLFSAKGLDTVQRDVLEAMVDERLNKGSYSLKRENIKRESFKKRAGEDGYVKIVDSGQNGELVFHSYEDERDFFNFLNDTMELIDFFYDPEGSRDLIYNAYNEKLSVSDTAKMLKAGLHEPERVTPPKKPEGDEGIGSY